MSDYEPPAEQVDALAKELHDAGRPAYGDRLPWQAMADVWQTMMRAEARFVLRRQHEREEPLLKELRDQLATWRQETPTRTKLERVLAAHAKLDAPKVPTLAGLFGKVLVVEGLKEGTVILSTSEENYVALKAAVEREEKR